MLYLFLIEYMPNDDFKNFFILKALEENKEEKHFFDFFFKNKWKILAVILTAILVAFLYTVLFTKINLANYVSRNYLFQINSGESVGYIGQRLKEDKVIKSSLAFKVYVKLFSGKELAQAGIYKLEKGDNLVSLASKIVKGKYAIPPVKITIPEGSDSLKTANIISEAFLSLKDKSILIDDFSQEKVYEEISKRVGYLFPETYSFLPNVYLSEVVKQMENNFYTRLYNFFDTEKVNLNIFALDLGELNLEDYFNKEDKTINLNKRLTIINQIGTSTLSIKDIITMASYLEGEANNEQDMRMVAGALWTRLKIGYPLQIDAATSTYKHKGFTETPINNPGIIAIRSTVNPINLGYIYYITGNDGKNYYAKTYDEHLNNINKYLRNK